MSKDADVDRLTIEEMCEAAIRLDSHSVPRNRRWTRQKAEALRDLALSALEVPVMAGPRGMQKAYDKGFADGQEKTWKAVQENTSVRPDYISSQANAHGEQPRPTDSSPATALSQEAVRDEAVVAIAKQDAGMYSWSTYVHGVLVGRWTVGLDRTCEINAKNFARAINAAASGIVAWGCDRESEHGRCANWCGGVECPVTLRALKREPNAAAQERVRADVSSQGNAPAPAAPNRKDWPTPTTANGPMSRMPTTAASDVAKATVAILKAEEVVFNAAIVADDRMRYEEAKNLRKLSEALKQAAALLAKLGQGWISVSERLPEENMRVLVRRGRGTDLFNPCVARYHYQTGRGEWWQYEPDFVSATQPTHWMPLPPAPGAPDE